MLDSASAFFSRITSEALACSMLLGSFDLDSIVEWRRTCFFWGLIIVAGIAICFIAVFVIAGLIEKQRISTCDPIQPGEDVGNDAYLEVMTCEASDAGFADQGRFRHPKYKILSSILFSPDQKTVALIGAGKTLNLRTRRTLLITPLASNRFLVTTDETGLFDVSETFVIRLVLNGGFVELWLAHQQRLEENQGEIRGFSEMSAVEAVEWPMRSQAEASVAAGHGRFVGEDQQTWCYTLSGICRAMNSQFGKLRRTAMEQKERSNLPRPGDAKYIRRSVKDAEIFDMS